MKTYYAKPNEVEREWVLIDATNQIMPEGIRAGKEDVAKYNLNRKRAMAHSIVGTATTAAVVVGAVPIPLADAAILTPIEIAEVNSIARVYGIHKSDKSKAFMNTIVEVGTISTVARAAISAIKGIPGINIAASVLNAVIAGSIAAALGEGSIYAFEQIYLGKKSLEDTEWVKKLMENKFSSDFLKRVNIALDGITSSSSKKEIAQTILKLIVK